jgi:hypothetical protein
MGIKEVTALRKQGKLKEAYNLAIADLEQDSSNIFNKRSLAWVYFEYLKFNAVAEKYDNFISILDKIVELELPETENMFFDYSGGQVVKLIFNLLKEEKAALKKHADEGFIINVYSKEFISKVDAIFQRIQNFHVSKPSESYSYLIKAFHAALKDAPQYIQFVEYWGLNHLMPADFEPKILPDEKKTISFGESAIIAYLKLVLNHRFSNDDKENRELRRQKIEEIIPTIESIDKQYPTLQYISYYRAKLLIAKGDSENVLSAFLPFAIRKRTQFWVWELLADLFPQNDEKHLACLCKALSIDAQEEMQLKLRQKMAKVLVEKKLFNEAKFEITQCIETRTKHQWKISSEIENFTKSEWYANATLPENNRSFYKKHSTVAEDILYQNNPEIAVVIEFVNTDKKILNFVANEEIHGFFNYENRLKNPKIGDVLLLRIDKREESGRTKTITVRIAPAGTECPALQTFEGTLKIQSDKNFGFVDDVFFPPHEITQHKLIDGQFVTGYSVLSFNQTKKIWGKKVMTVKT